MEVPISWLFTLLITLLIIFITISKFIPKKPPSKKAPPGPPNLPMVGNLHQLAAKNSLPHHRLAELAVEYGPIMRLHIGKVPAIVVSSVDIADEVMRNQHHNATCCSLATLMLAKEILSNNNNVIPISLNFAGNMLAPYGEEWGLVRKKLAMELLSWKWVESIESIREEEVANLHETLVSQAGSVVNLTEKLFGLTFDMTSRSIFKKKGKELQSLQALITATMEACSGFSTANIYPLTKLLPKINGLKRELQKIVLESSKIVDPMIQEHKLNRGQGRKEEQDLVDILLAFHKDNNEEAEFNLTTESIKALIGEFFGIGSVISSSILESTMSELLKNPSVMAKAQEEVRREYQANGVVDATKLEKLKYLKLVIEETLRLHPPFPLLALGQTKRSYQIQGYDIPPKSILIVNVWATARDPNYWSQPDKFIPERFENSIIDYKQTYFKLIPFGARRGECPGKVFGIANIELPLANLLYHFDWKLPDIQPKDLNMDESFSVTRKNELLVIPIPYS